MTMARNDYDPTYRPPLVTTLTMNPYCMHSILHYTQLPRVRYRLVYLYILLRSIILDLSSGDEVVLPG